jgi:sugar O-acyltransferase (sialic acid O-acetyltransferase NeuD family)
MRGRLAILGGGGHGKVVAEAAESTGWRDIVFFDDVRGMGQPVAAWEVIGNSAALQRSLDVFTGVVVAIGRNAVRRQKARELLDRGARLLTIVDASALVSRRARLGAGTVVLPGAHVNIGAAIGLAGIVNTGATIDHDCVLGDGVHICPGAHLAGEVRIGDETWIGIGASVVQRVSIGSGVTVGAGAAVIGDVPDNVTVVGVPAGIKRQAAPC